MKGCYDGNKEWILQSNSVQFNCIVVKEMMFDSQAIGVRI